MTGTLPPEHDAEIKLTLERIVFFSDAVMAIAMTLLAVDLKVPESAQALVDAELRRQLGGMMPAFTGFFISFLLVAIYWAFHLRIFRFIKRFDAGLIALNLAFLFTIAVLPFTSSLIGHYGTQTIPAVIYAVNAAALGMMALAIWAYATHGRRLVEQTLDEQLERLVFIGGLGAPIGFLLSIPVAVVNPQATQYVWWFVPGGITVAVRWFWRLRFRRD
jgi:uncharacterized membrane protein